MPFVLEQTAIRNVYNLHIQNKTTEPKTYRISEGEVAEGAGVDVSFIIPQSEVRLEGLADTQVPIIAMVDRSAWTQAFEITFVVSEPESGVTRKVNVRFRGP